MNFKANKHLASLPPRSNQQIAREKEFEGRRIQELGVRLSYAFIQDHFPLFPYIR
jgi:hypothetical protein